MAYFRAGQATGLTCVHFGAHVLRDTEVHPRVREVTQLRATPPVRGSAMPCSPVAPHRRTTGGEAVLDLALSFHTWQSLVRGSSLTSADAAALMSTRPSVRDRGPTMLADRESMPRRQI